VNSAQPNLGTWSSDETQECPYPFFEKLLEEAPVYRDPVTGMYIVTRYADISYVVEHPEIFSNRVPIAIQKKSPASAEMARRYAERGFPELFILSFDDPPQHDLHRALVGKVFTPSYIRQIEPYLVDLSNDMIDAFIADGAVDLKSEFAVKLPMSVIADQLGVDRADYADFAVWSSAWNARHDPRCTPERELELTDLIIEMQNYLHVRAQRYLAKPADNMLSRLAHSEIDGRRLSMGELINIAQLILVAGNETTTTAIGSAMYLLLKDPDLKRRLMADEKLLPNFIEESLRIESPVPHLPRITTQDTSLGGVNIPKDAIILVMWSAGNYDPSQWDRPKCVDMNRKGVRNHLTFGRGIHHCVGNLLARAELRTAIQLLLRRLEDLRLDDSYPAPRYAPHFQVHALDHLRVKFKPGKRLREATEPPRH
jgi:cytochrome P450